jgi:hypothetical protein
MIRTIRVFFASKSNALVYICYLMIHYSEIASIRNHPFFAFTSPYAGGASAISRSGRLTAGATLVLCVDDRLSAWPWTLTGPFGTSLNSFSSLISTSFLNALNASATSLPSSSDAIFTLITPVSSMATSVASRRVPSSGSEGEPGIRARQAGLEEDVGGVVGMGASYLRREKKSLMSWFSRLIEPFDVAREMRPSLRIGLA